MALLEQGENTKTNADVVTLSESKILVLPKEAFHDALMGHPQVKEDLANVGLSRIKETNDRNNRKELAKLPARAEDLGKPGFTARINGLSGSIGKQVNGQLCTRIVRHKSGGFLVDVPQNPPAGDPISLLLYKKNLTCLRVGSSRVMKQDLSPEAGAKEKTVRVMGNNRSSVKLSLQELRLRVKREMRNAVNARGGDMKAFFRELDFSNSG